MPCLSGHLIGPAYRCCRWVHPRRG